VQKNVQKGVQNKLFRKAALERLSSPERLDQSIQVMRSRGWLALAALGLFLLAVVAWALFGNIPMFVEAQGILVANDSGQGAPLQVIIFMPVRLVGRIDSDMQAQVIPLTLSPDQYGYASGHVQSIERVPVKNTRLTAVLNTPNLQQALAPSGLAVEVHVTLDPGSGTDYQWSKAAAPADTMQPGVPVLVHLTIANQHPINLIFPSLR
jgi:hypothetical protein